MLSHLERQSASDTKKRIAIGGIWHETNTFASGKSDYSAFETYQLAKRDELIRRYRGSNTELGGFIGHAETNRFQLVPTLFAAAVPSGIIEHQTAMKLCHELIDTIHNAGSLDAIFLSLHGAAIAEEIDDLDGFILERLRSRFGPQIPIVITIDYHANVTEKMVRHASVIIGYDTYPHVDMAERGEEAAQVAARILETNQVPHCSFKRIPLITSPLNQQTDKEPMRGIFQLLHEIEEWPQILCGTVAMGFPYCDVDHLGASVLVYGTEPTMTEKAVNSLSNRIWEKRKIFTPEVVSVKEGIRQAVNAESFPVVVVEAADNIGGGSAGDATDVLAELIRIQAKGSVMLIADPEAVQKAISSGVGSRTALKIGGKSDRFHGSPVEIFVTVRSVSDGEYVHKGSYMTGYVSSMGKAAVVDADGITIVLTSRRSMPFDAEQLRCVGIEPQKQKIITVKSAIAWKAAYGDIAKQTIVVDSSGVCPIDLSKLQYHSRPKPLFPLDG